jgi:sugar lactone lactonase YvrE
MGCCSVPGPFPSVTFHVRQAFIFSCLAAILQPLMATQTALAAQSAHYAGVESKVAGCSSECFGVAVDTSGNVFIADTYNNRILEESPSAAGYTQSVVATGFNKPYGVAVDLNGNVYVADTFNKQIVKETLSSGAYTPTIIASGLSTTPFNVAVDNLGNVYFAGGNSGASDPASVTKLTPSGSSYIQSVVAGASSGMQTPWEVAVDSSGNIYVTDADGNAVYKETPSGSSYLQSTVATGLDFPTGVAVDPQGNVYVANAYANQILMESPGAAGTYSQSVYGTSTLSFPYELASDTKGNLYIANSEAFDVLKETPGNVDFGSVNVGTQSAALNLIFIFDSAEAISTPSVVTQGIGHLDFEDTGSGSCTTNGTSLTYSAGQTCTLSAVFDPTLSGFVSGAAVLTDHIGNQIAVAYLRGTGVSPQVSFPPGSQITLPSNGLQGPSGIAVDAAGNIFFIDGNNVMEESYENGQYTLGTLFSNLSSPTALALDGAGNIYIAESNTVIRETPYYGGYYPSLTINSLSLPTGLAVDGEGNLFIADWGAFRAYKVSPTLTGYTSTSIGSGLQYPFSIAVDAAGAVYIADGTDGTLTVETPGTSGYSQSIITLPDTVVTSIATDRRGNLYTSYQAGSTVLEWTPSSGTYAPTTIGSNISFPIGVAVARTGDVLIANEGSAQILKVDFADPPTLNFATSTYQTTSGDSPKSITLQNIGNALLEFSTPSSGQNPSISSSFTLGDGAFACPIIDSGSSTVSLSAGSSCDLSISFTPLVVGTISGSLVITDNALNGNPSRQSISLTGAGIATTQTTPTITWPAPAAIVYGTALSATELDATASVPGTFSYSPGLGTILAAGSHTLSVTFTPTDEVDYTAAKSTVTLVVNPVTANSTYTVTTLGDSTGSCSGGFCTTLRAAITAANDSSGNTINFSGLSGTITLTSALPAISRSMIITGPGASSLTISGNSSYQIFYISSTAATVSISGLNLTAGTSSHTTNGGGGAINNAGTLTVTNSTLSMNIGSAIANGFGALTITNSSFFGNSGNYGGAVSSDGNTTVKNCTFSENSGDNGGGAIFSQGALNVTNSTFSGNFTTAPYNPNNGGYGGGAILSFGTVMQVFNSTFSGNSTAGVGGAIYANLGSTLTANNNIFVGNTVSTSNGGAAIAVFGLNASYNLYFENLDATGAESDCAGCASNTHAITGENPHLLSLGFYGGSTKTLLPLPGSPAICAGSPSQVPTGTIADQRGYSRTTIYDSTTCVDLGADQTDYTAVAFSAPSFVGDPNQLVVPTPVVTVTENGQNIGGVPITLAYTGSGSPTGLGPVTTVNGAGATFGSLTAPATAIGTLSVNLPITASGNSVQPAALTASASFYVSSTVQLIDFAPPPSLTYGTAPFAISATGGPSGNPVILSLDPASTPGAATLNGNTLTIKSVGTVVIDANQAAGNGYIAAPQAQESIVIKPASVTITASSPTVTYGAAVPTITASFGTFVNGDTSAVLTRQPTCTTAYTTTSAVGSSPATSCSGAAAANYTFTYVNGSFTINPASVTITASSPAVIYGSAVPTITPGFSGFLNGDTSVVLTKQPTCTTAYTTTSAVVSSPATSCSGAAAANYTFSYVNGSVTINPASVTITASSPAVIYGSAVPTITPGFSGFLNGDTSVVLTKQPTCTTAYTLTSPVGSSPATSCSGARAANYAITYVSGSVTVNQALLTITASSPTVIYGSAVPTITPSFSGFVNGETSSVLTMQPNCTTAYTTTSPVGSSPATSCSGAAAANYAITYVNGSVTVNAAPTFVVGSGSTSSITIAPGATTGNTVPITVTPANGFTGVVNLTCAISPAATNDPATCSLSPNSVTITGNGAQTSTLTLNTTAATSSQNQMRKVLWPSAGGTALALLLCFVVPRRRRNWLTLVAVLALSLTIATAGCGGGGNGGGGNTGNPGTTPGNYTVTVTGSSGNITGTVGTIALTVQ